MLIYCKYLGKVCQDYCYLCFFFVYEL